MGSPTPRGRPTHGGARTACPGASPSRRRTGPSLRATRGRRRRAGRPPPGRRTPRAVRSLSRMKNVSSRDGGPGARASPRDATTMQVLYSSGPDDLLAGGKYYHPVVARGFVFVGTDRISAFGLVTTRPRK